MHLLISTKHKVQLWLTEMSDNDCCDLMVLLAEKLKDAQSFYNLF